MNNLEVSTGRPPLIKRYSHILTYLKDYYSYRKSVDPQFSHDLWSLELGFKSSSYMYLIMSGRRTITLKFIDEFAAQLNFNQTEKNHMTLLAGYNKTKSPSLKAILFDKILENVEGDENIIEAKNYFKFVSSKTMPVMVIALACDDVKGTTQELSAILNISLKKVRQDLGLLEKMGLIKKVFSETSREVRWKPAGKDFIVPDDRSNTIMDSFYQQTLHEAETALIQTDIFKRFRSILFPVNPKDHQIVLAEIEGFLSKLKNRFKDGKMTGKHMLKLNLNAYPVSQVKEA